MMARAKRQARGPNREYGRPFDKEDRRVQLAERERIRLDVEDDAPEFGGRDVDLMAARGELNLRTWLDD